MSKPTSILLVILVIAGFAVASSNADEDADFCKSNKNSCNDMVQDGDCEQSSSFMKKRCEGYCEKCSNLAAASSRMRTAQTPKAKHPYDCKDKPTFDCEELSLEDSCEDKHMMKYCPEFCGLCSYEGLCLDRAKNCAELATAGECQKNVTYMIEHCPQSCGKCGAEGFCLDNSKTCASLADAGECTNNSTIMNELCPLSCGKCGPGELCLDKNKQCPIHAANGDCTKNVTEMTEFCPASCEKCGKGGLCLDKSKKCGAMAAAGDCKSNKKFMKETCPVSCGFKCDDLDLDCEEWAKQGACKDAASVKVRLIMCQLAMKNGDK